MSTPDPLEVALRAWERNGAPNRQSLEAFGLAARLRDAGVEMRPRPPQGTRLILASENLFGLEMFGTRTDDGYKITAEWGEPSPEGWYEPRFTVHHDQPLIGSDAAILKTLEQIEAAVREDEP